MNQATGISDLWNDALADWAAGRDRIQEVYVFGSRAKRNHRDDSDLDVALVLTGEDQAERDAYWISEASTWRKELASKFPIVIDLESAHPADASKIVWPAVKNEGLRVYLKADPSLQWVSDAFHQMGWFIPPSLSRGELFQIA